MSTLSDVTNMAADYFSNTGPKVYFLFDVPSVECEFSVVEFTVDERISHPYEIDIILATQDEVVLENILYQNCLLTIDKQNSKRFFHGVVKECTCIGDQGDYSIFHMIAVPSLWLLSLEQDCRIFQNMNVQDIVLKILEESRILSNTTRLALQNKDRKREFCVQYRETDLNFISRLLEEEGIYYYFEHCEDKHVIVFADNPVAYGDISGVKQITFNTGSGAVAQEESVSTFIYSRRLCPGKIVQRDFNYNRVDLDLTTKKEAKQSNIHEVYDYPGNYFKQANGQDLADIRQERLQLLGETAEGISNSPRLTPGYKWELTGYDFEGEYVTVAATHHGEQPQALKEQSGGGKASYRNEFLVVPAKVVVRPQIDAVKPVINGFQTATVTGPKSEEINVDDQGRITVQFHWDREGQRNEKSSCRLRVVQPWGGGSWGAQFIPRIGDEVVIEFADGDPDRPMITGSVYNGNNQPINSLKKSVTQSGFRTKTHKGDGYNELRFDDANGAQEVYLQAEKDYNVVAKNNRSQDIGGSSGTSIGGDSNTRISKNKNEFVGSDSYSQVTGTRTDIAKEIILSADSQITLVVGGNSIVISSGDIKINGATVYVNDGSQASAPATKEVSGATCHGGGSSSSSGAKSSSASNASNKSSSSSSTASTSSTPAASPETSATQSSSTPSAGVPETTPAVSSVADTPVEEPLADYKGDIPSGDFAGLSTKDIKSEYGDWGIGSVKDKATGASDLMSSESPSAFTKMVLANAALSAQSGDVKGALTNVANQQANQAIGNAQNTALSKAGLGNTGGALSSIKNFFKR